VLETSELKPAPVRVISEAIGEYLNRLGMVWIEGELSEVNERPGSQMVFMRLRDTSAEMSISVMCYKNVLESVKPLPENARVVINSKVTWFAKSGSLTFSAKEIKQVGVGELLARLEHLKQVLAAEGLFSAERKKPLPFLPNKVGLICGRGSAAEKDVIENAKRRWPAVEFEIRTVAVQGSQAVLEVSAALKELEANSEVDVIIITRGGGSFEDLLPFSDEGLVRLAASCKTPIVSAIGHEQDAPLLDLVADWRASTPTDAAKKVVPDIAEEKLKISQLQDRVIRKIVNQITSEMEKIAALIMRPFMKDPTKLITYKSEELTHITARLRTLSPQATLERGYTIVRNLKGEIVKAASSLRVDEQINLKFATGTASATTRAIDSINTNTSTNSNTKID
jgi:exodeoxyribonuclease VII large subunit